MEKKTKPQNKIKLVRSEGWVISAISDVITTHIVTSEREESVGREKLRWRGEERRGGGLFTICLLMMSLLVTLFNATGAVWQFNTLQGVASRPFTRSTFRSNWTVPRQQCESTANFRSSPLSSSSSSSSLTSWSVSCFCQNQPSQFQAKVKPINSTQLWQNFSQNTFLHSIKY